MDLSHVPAAELESFAGKIKATVQMWTGILISIGIGSTKTLAKLANKKAKESTTGILDLAHHPDLDEVLAGIEVGEIWGIGRKWAKRLRGLRIFQASDLKQARPELIRQKLSVVGERIVLELRGIPRLPIEEKSPPKQSIVVSRSFGRPVTGLQELREVAYLCRAAEKLRREGQVARSLTVFLVRGRYGDGDSTVSVTRNLIKATDDTRELLSWGILLVEELFELDNLGGEDPLFPWAQMAFENGELESGARVGQPCRKVGVMLSQFEPAQAVQGSLWERVEGSQGVLEFMDRVNRDWGAETLRFAVMGLERAWQMQAGMRSPRFTTRWGEIPVVRVG
ncbi:MAG: DUF4113 domain-containing protein [Cyanobacteriota bacterium]